MNFFFLFLSAILVNNFVLVQFLGICPFIGVSKQIETSIGMGLATTFVMVVASAATWLVQHFILEPFNLPFLQNVAFILVIASMVQLVEMFLRKTSPNLYNAMGIYLPLITTNCAILGMALILVLRSYAFGESLVYGLGAGLGFTLALVLMAGIREELKFADIPKPFQGAGIAFILAGLLSLAFSGFAGLV
ncbi:MAG: electron transport complex subunit RsxA [Firmicutes bacterium]|nr:electron transport complex subunit RsxA [Bacillota bacterium]